MKDNPMKGKIVLVTGASSGLGLATAIGLAKLGAEIVMACRDAQRGERALRQVAQVATDKPPLLLLVDVSSQSSVRSFADELRVRVPRLDVLVNNAGVIFATCELTSEGIEKTFATNYLGPFLLTHLVLGLLEAAPSARVVNIVSALHGATIQDLDNLQGERHYSFMKAYKLSKFALIVFTYELARRLSTTRIVVNCVEPGPTKTQFGDNMTGLPSLFPRVMKRLPLFRSVEVGARTPLYVASSREIEGTTGQYFEKCKPAKSKPITHNRAVASRLWVLSELLTGSTAAGTSILNVQKAANQETAR